MTRITILLSIFALAFGEAREASQSPRAVVLTVLTPAPEQLELALNEVELQWREDRGSANVQAAVPNRTSRAVVKSSAAGRAVFEASGAQSLEEMRPLASDLERENPGALAYLVLYEVGKPHSEATRRLLGREVAVIFSQGVDARTVLANTGALDPRPLESVPRAYVVNAVDPASALELARALQALPGVTTAYPLLQRRRSGR